MKRKKFSKLAIILSTAALSLGVFFCPAASITTYAAEPDYGVMPASDIIEWRFKTENGKLYRRLYNCSTGSWVGDWLYVCDL